MANKLTFRHYDVLAKAQDGCWQKQEEANELPPVAERKGRKYRPRYSRNKRHSS